MENTTTHYRDSNAPKTSAATPCVEQRIKETDTHLLSVWALDADGHKVYPYKGLRGDKRGLYSVNFTTDTKKFQGMTGEQLVDAIEQGRFRQRGSVRMSRLDRPGCNAFAPVKCNDRNVKDY